MLENIWIFALQLYSYLHLYGDYFIYCKFLPPFSLFLLLFISRFFRLPFAKSIITLENVTILSYDVSMCRPRPGGYPSK